MLIGIIVYVLELRVKRALELQEYSKYRKISEYHAIPAETAAFAALVSV